MENPNRPEKGRVHGEDKENDKGWATGKDCPIYCPRATRRPQARAEKSRATTAARKWINDKTARGKMEMLLWANFTERDLYVTLTYDDAHLPKNRKEAQENVRKIHTTSQGALEKGRGGITLYLCDRE